MNPHTQRHVHTHSMRADTERSCSLTHTGRRTASHNHSDSFGKTRDDEGSRDAAGGDGFRVWDVVSSLTVLSLSLSVSCLYSHVSPSLDDFSHFAVSRDAAASRVQDFSFASSRIMFACTSSLLLLPLLPSSSRCLHFRSS